MMTADGPRVLEFNTRFGDPETQALLPRLDEDLLGLLTAAADGELEDRPRAGQRRAPPSRWCWPPHGYPAARRGRATSSPGLDEAAATGAEVLPRRHGAAARAARSSRPAAACWRWARAATASRRRGARAYAAAELDRFDGRQMRRRHRRGDGRPRDPAA